MRQENPALTQPPPATSASPAPEETRPVIEEVGVPETSPPVAEGDPVARVVAQMSQFSDGLDAIRTEISRTGGEFAKPQTLGETTVEQLTRIIEGLRAVPVQVEIKVVPVQESATPPAGNIAPDDSPVAIAPTVVQGETQDDETQDARDQD